MVPQGHSLTEQETRSRLINPALQQAGWDLGLHVREEYPITAGQITVRGAMHSRARPRRADYVLFRNPNTPIAVIEAKDAQQGVGAGMQQALTYAEMLGVPFAFSTNGREYLFHDKTRAADHPIEVTLHPQDFPNPATLWEKYLSWRGLETEAQKDAADSQYFSAQRKSLRYYQGLAIQRTVEAVAKGQKRLLLVMATGSGKTFTAFQTIWRLREAGLVQRVLFLVDRNVLADQTLINDFAPFGSIVTKVTNRHVDKSYEIYVALYQAVTGAESEDDIFQQFSPDFFDLVVVDECHRGSAAADSSWRRVLEYFSPACQIGLTATPRETNTVSNTAYFGEPIYVYSLRQGIADGFLAPFKVTRFDIDRDLSGWRPVAGQSDRYGQEIPDRVYRSRDFDRSIILDTRTQLVAQSITDFMKSHNRMAKTIVFCEDIDHAERMRNALVNANADLVAESGKYIVRITGDSPYGQQDLDDFMNPESQYPVVVTTSRLLRTGVDVQTCQIIVLDQNISSATEFKQIVGRGTRIREDFGKMYFNILDYRGVTELFADPEFDGPPIESIGSADSAPLILREPALDVSCALGQETTDEYSPRTRFVVDGVTVEIINKRVQYFNADGVLVTESITDYTKRSVVNEYVTLDGFLKRWHEADRKTAIIDELSSRGVSFDLLEEEIGSGYDPFDLLCHVAFGRRPMTRRERADVVRGDSYLDKYSPVARQVLDALLTKYADGGPETLEDVAVLRLQPVASLGTPVEIMMTFGGRDGYLEALRGLEMQIYKAA